MRRDLDVLAAAGLLEKVHGGATLPRQPQRGGARLRGEVPSPAEGEGSDRARGRAELVEPGQAIGLTAGTTTWRLAHHLAQRPT